MSELHRGFDHVEFVVSDLEKHSKMYERMGFRRLGEAKLSTRGLWRRVYGQGKIRMMLTQPLTSGAADESSSSPAKFLKAHGDGITVLALEVDNARRTFEKVVKNGAKVALEPVRYGDESDDAGQVWRAEIYTPCDLRYAFIERKKASTAKDILFDDGLTVDSLENPSPFHLQSIDHLTNNVSMGEMQHWVDWYERVFDFEVVRHFDIRTGRTGLISDVVRSKNGLVTVPINEATEKESQVQEFVERFRGPGVQHLAFLTADIMNSLTELRRKDFKFLTVPSTYYEQVPVRVPGVSESLAELEKLGILLDGEETGYLLQVFSEELVGPFFLEFIQRKGNQGFGEGNFRALFEAIERDQVLRGVLKG